MTESVVDIEFIKQLALKSGNRIKYESIVPKNIKHKVAMNDLVTETDIVIEKSLKEEIIQKYPNSCFFCEESDHKCITDGLTWIIDPIDGTTNFVYNIPFYSVSIGVMYRKQLIAGVVYVPYLDELFYAEKGKGAYCNGVKITTSTKTSLRDVLVATGFGAHLINKHTYNDPKAEALKEELFDVVKNNFSTLLKGCRGIRRFGACSIDICYVACGRTDAFVEFGPWEWDVAAGTLILMEAGGVASTHDGRDFNVSNHDFVFACNQKIATDLQNALMNYDVKFLKLLS